jgi:hypothetical protein
MVNRLAGSTSPYLLQHKDNPVDWQEWGPEAFTEAERLGRPILLSVGYSACHWCHVMAHESFEDDEVAAAINADFVAIKVGRRALLLWHVLSQTLVPAAALRCPRRLGPPT